MYERSERDRDWFCFWLFGLVIRECVDILYGWRARHLAAECGVTRAGRKETMLLDGRGSGGLKTNMLGGLTRRILFWRTLFIIITLVEAAAVGVVWILSLGGFTVVLVDSSNEEVGDEWDEGMMVSGRDGRGGGSRVMSFLVGSLL